MDLLRDVGAVAGVAAFLGLAVLALLYFAQARDVRRLRENAEFLVEGEPGGSGEAAPPTAVTTPGEPEQAARAAAASAPTDAEAFRRAELARQAAERRQRFESRRTGNGRTLRERFAAGPSVAVIVVGAVILLAGIGFGATQLLGGDEEGGDGGGDGGGKNLACSPQQTKVAVLNSTPEAGLAAGFAKQLKQRGYDVGPISNTESPFEASTVMFDQGSQQCVAEVGPVVSIAASQPMDQEVRGIAEGAQLAVVLGDDKSTGATSATEESADTTGTLVD
jgi:LytR cell envelope-related transcriptional attenuator